MKEEADKPLPWWQGFNGDDSWTLPMPARYIIDQDAIIRAAEVDPDYTIRPEPSQTIEQLQTISGSQRASRQPGG